MVIFLKKITKFGNFNQETYWRNPESPYDYTRGALGALNGNFLTKKGGGGVPRGFRPEPPIFRVKFGHFLGFFPKKK
jgi:hypothetical protein